MLKVLLTLERIESLLLSQKKVFNIADFCKYTGLSPSAAHKLTGQGKIPHSKPNGKIIFFDKEAVDKYLMSNPIRLADDIHQEAINFNTGRTLRGGGR